MANLDFQNPQAGVRTGGKVAQLARLINGMRKVGHPMAAHFQIQLPAQCYRALGGIVVQRGASAAGGLPMLAHHLPQGMAGVHAGAHVRVTAADKAGPPSPSCPSHTTPRSMKNIVLAQTGLAVFLAEGFQRAAKTDNDGVPDAPMPISSVALASCLACCSVMPG
jgi:hypothetical protein